jgi:hypothetical protein
MATSTPLAPLRTKVSADYGTVNTDISSAISANQTLTGPARTAPPAGQGILVNVNDGGSYVDGDVVLELGPSATGPWTGCRPLRVDAGGFTGFVYSPLGHGMPTAASFTHWRVSYTAKVASASRIVTSQPFSY